MPANVVTRTSMVLAAEGGATAVMAVSESTVKSAARPPKVTPLAPVKLLPVMTTLPPPAVVPVAGVMPLTEGAEALV